MADSFVVEVDKHDDTIVISICRKALDESDWDREAWKEFGSWKFTFIVILRSGGRELARKSIMSLFEFASRIDANCRIPNSEFSSDEHGQVVHVFVEFLVTSSDADQPSRGVMTGTLSGPEIEIAF